MEDQLHEPNDRKGDPAAVAGRGRSPGNLLRSPHFQVISALDAEALEAEQGEIHVPAWYVAGMTGAGQFLDEVLQPPDDGDGKFGVWTQSRRGQSRQDTEPSRRSPRASPSILDYQRRKKVIPARPTSLPRRSVTNARSREPS